MDRKSVESKARKPAASSQGAIFKITPVAAAIAITLGSSIYSQSAVAACVESTDGIKDSVTCSTNDADGIASGPHTLPVEVEVGSSLGTVTIGDTIFVDQNGANSDVIFQVDSNPNDHNVTINDAGGGHAVDIDLVDGELDFDSQSNSNINATGDGSLDGINVTGGTSATVDINSGSTINANDDGIDVTVGDDGNVTIENTGSITAGDMGITVVNGGDTDSSLTSITSSGSINSGDEGIFVQSDDGQVEITTSAGGTITTTGAGSGEGIRVTTSGFSGDEGDVDITIGDVIDSVGDGINVDANPNGTRPGDISITLLAAGANVNGVDDTDGVAGGSGGAIISNEDGIEVNGDTGKVTIVSNAGVTAEETGMHVTSQTGDVEITTGAGGTIATSGDSDDHGIFVQTDGSDDTDGEGDVTITVGDNIDTLTGEAGDGIRVETLDDNRSDVSITLLGSTDPDTGAAGGSIDSYDDGIEVNGKEGTMTIISSAAIDARDEGIQVTAVADQLLVGDVIIKTTEGGTITAGGDTGANNGIDVTANQADVDIVIGDTINTAESGREGDDGIHVDVAEGGDNDDTNSVNIVLAGANAVIDGTGGKTAGGSGGNMISNSDGIEVVGERGDVSILASASIDAQDEGIQVVTTSNQVGAGDIDIKTTSGGAITAGGAGGENHGISVGSNQSNVSIIAGDTIDTTASGREGNDGINVDVDVSDDWDDTNTVDIVLAGAGDVIPDTGGNIAGSSGGNIKATEDGIDVDAENGTVNITSSAAIEAGDEGIQVEANDADINITTHAGGTIEAGGADGDNHGIWVELDGDNINDGDGSGSGDVTITIGDVIDTVDDAGDATDAAGNVGIFVDADPDGALAQDDDDDDTNNVTVMLLGANAVNTGANGGAVKATDDAIRIRAEDGIVTVDSAAAISSETDDGIEIDSGNGAVNVTTKDGGTINAGDGDATDHGIDIESDSGAVTVQVGDTINATGDGVAVNSGGIGDVTITLLAADPLDANSDAGASGGEINAEFDGINASSTDGNVTVTANANVTGGESAIDVNAGEVIEVSIGADATIIGKAADETDPVVYIAADESILLTNNGTIRSDGATKVIQSMDIAIDFADDGSLVSSVLNNNGTIIGRFYGSDEDDVFNNNSNTTWTFTGISDFGAGDDVLNNTYTNPVTFGVVENAVDSSAYETAQYIDLEQFNNAGVVTMQDQLPGDAFMRDRIYTDGDYHGDDGMIAVDINLSAGSADSDRFIIGGEATGMTYVAVNNIGTLGGAYDPYGIPVIEIGTGGGGGAFELADGPIDTGIFSYDLYYTDDTSNHFDDDIKDSASLANINLGSAENETVGIDEMWVLASAPNATAFTLPHMLTGANNLWSNAAQTWLDRNADLRLVYADEAGAGQKSGTTSDKHPGAWVKAYGGSWDRVYANKVKPMLSPSSITYAGSFDSDYRGIVGGVDFLARGAPGGHEALIVGGLIGYGKSDMNFNVAGPATAGADFSATTLGVYATYMKNNFFIDAVLKADFGDIDYMTATGTGFSSAFSTDYQTIGFVVDSGYRNEYADGVFLEPKATISYSDTDIDATSLYGTGLNFNDGDSLKGRVGVRVGKTMEQNGTTMEPYAELNIWNQFSGQYNLGLKSGPGVAVGQDTGGSYGELTLGANFYSFGKGVNGFVKASAQSGEDVDGVSGHAGIRATW